MSFLDGILSVGKSAIGPVAQIAGLAFIASQMNKNTNAQNQIPGQSTPANIDEGVRLQIPPASNNKIPVLYGTAFFGGVITDAAMTNTNKTMFYCLTLSEKTGTLLSTSAPSDYVFKNIYWNDQRIVFKTDGITVDYTVDRDSNQDISLRDQVKIYCYKGSSAQPTIPENYTNTSTVNAALIMPGWTTSTHQMNDLVFAIVRVDYSREKNVTGIGDLLFHIQNSMNLPGDVLYDYMTNSRYGAGITATEILSS